jgi:hypothetical protein
VNDVLIPITSSIAVGSTVISDIPTTGLSVGDILLLHVTQAPVEAASPAGTYELVKITSIAANSVAVSPPVSNAYVTSSTTRIQCVRVPQYDQVMINGSIVAPAWNGTTGGIVALITQKTIVASAGNIDADGRGFRGAPALSALIVGSSGGTAHQGESFVAATWPLPRTTAANYSGGGGGGHAPSDLPNNFHGEGGGGGGNTSAGRNGGNYNGFYPNGVGTGGSMVAPTSSNFLIFGGGGGGGGVNGVYDAGEYGGFGGFGGGAIMLITGSLVLEGKVSASGTMGQSKAHHVNLDGNGGYDNRSPGGGGAGGSILISARVAGGGAIAALLGKSGDAAATVGDGSPGRIQMNRESFGNVSISPPHYGTSSSSILPASMSWLLTYYDQDQDGLDDFREYQAGTSPNLPDSDFDGLPDLWETQVGLSPINANGDIDSDDDGFTNWLEYLIGSNPLVAGGILFTDSDSDGVPDSWENRYGTQVAVADAHIDLDGDGLSNLEEFRVGSRPDLNDSDSDGLSDHAERFIYGTRLMSSDTDSDGLPDAWEFTNGLNPLFNDANLDADGDGLTNAQEYNSGLNSTNPRNRDSDNNGVSDYEQRNGAKFIKHRYDRNDRLVTTLYNNGAWEGWRYDGNGTILRHLLRISRDADNDGLADAWEFAQGLAFDSSAGTQGFGGDADGDGWTNQQEFLADTAANDATSIPPTGTGSTAWATPPKSRIVFPAASGGALAHVSVRLWDAEANRAQAILQWWDATANLWKPANLSKVNNGPITNATSLTATPAGTTHDFLWNALADLPAHNGTILLRTTSQDPAGTTTSETVPYALNTAGDFDGDGIPDTWEIAHNLDPNDATGTQGATADTDYDGLNTFGEYAFVLNLTASDAKDAATTSTAINPADGKRYLTLTYRKRLNATGLTYTVQTSSDLTTWTPNGPDIEPITTTPAGDGLTELVTVRIKPPLEDEGAKKFVRVEVTAD